MIVLATAKIHILKQFTTAALKTIPAATLCLLLQRYTFWSNSQRSGYFYGCRCYCACYCKDTHFEAIHNRLLFVVQSRVIVLATAKIHILKQFTTTSVVFFLLSLLCLLLQRYTFWSNSQHTCISETLHLNCACYCKDTHFEAIHNILGNLFGGGAIVLATAKIHILKQFTTRCSRLLLLRLLCLLLQRYTFWSNSQPSMKPSPNYDNCACYCKDTHFEAIHNYLCVFMMVREIVLATAKIHILKQFTTKAVVMSGHRHCACYCKDTHFEAIHNLYAEGHPAGQLCLLLQRYTFWSNSQRSRLYRLIFRHCACYCKDTHFEAIHNRLRVTTTPTTIVLATAKIHILKQFTTGQRRKTIYWRLCLLLQRYTFWSNSQQDNLRELPFYHCACYCKDTHFEAIHNRLCRSCTLFHCACYCKDTHFEAIHNRNADIRRACRLCLLLQRYTFWSNSQPLLGNVGGDPNCACYCKDTHFEAIHNKTY